MIAPLPTRWCFEPWLAFPPSSKIEVGVESSFGSFDILVDYCSFE